MQQSFYIVAGLGQTGRSIMHYLKHRQQAFAVFDTREHIDDLPLLQREFPEVKFHLGQFPVVLYEHVTAIIASPGLALDEPFLREALARHIPIWGDVECFAKEVKAPVIAITGTNGKSTVTTLVGEMAKAAGYQVAVAGNIGVPVLTQLDNGMAYDLWVLELSSFQLALTSSLTPLAATILNISTDHLDWHHSLAAYCEAKQRIYEHSQHAIYNRDDLQTLPHTVSQGAKKISYGLNAPLTTDDWGIQQKDDAFYLAQGETCLLSVDALALRGKHNWQNALAACALASCAGIKPEIMVQVLRAFTGLKHRCQWVRTLDAVQWINDSKGTNVGATISAITGIGATSPGKIILIAGGLGKGADFNELKPSVASHVRAAVLIGRDADKLDAALSLTIPVSHAASMEEAVQLAKILAQNGDSVLLSPACASFDMFRDFNHRGDVFMGLVNQL